MDPCITSTETFAPKEPTGIISSETPSGAFAIDCATPETEDEMLVLIASVLFTMTGTGNCDGLGVVVVATILLGVVVVVLGMMAAGVVVVSVACFCVHMHMQTKVRECHTQLGNMQLWG